MAYGQKYQLQFTDLDNNVIKIIISQDGYSGALMNFIGSENPIITKLDKSGDDRFEPLKPTSMEIGIFVDTAGWIVGQESSNFEEFYEIDNFEYRVDKYLNSVLDWSGYINDEVFTEPYQPGKYVVHLTATDGMSILKGRYTELTGRVTHFDMIQECMDAIGLGLNIVDAIGVTEVGHTTGGPLQQTMFDANVFTEEKTRWTLEKMLRDVLRTYSACLSQVHGKWVISNVESFYGGISGYEYTDESVYVDSYTGDGEKHIEPTLGSSIVTLLTGGSIQKNKGWKELRVKRNFGNNSIDGIIENGDFSQKIESIDSEGHLSSQIKNWFVTILGQTFELPSNFLKDNPTTGSYLFLSQNADEEYNTVTSGESKYIAPDTVNTYAFSGKFALLQTGDGSGSGRYWKTAFQVITVGSTPAYNYYLTKPDPITGLSTWTDVPTTLVLDNDGDLILQQNQEKFKWIEIPPVRVLGFPGGTVVIKLYHTHKTGIVLSFTGTAWDDIRFYCEAASSQQSGNGVLIGQPLVNGNPNKFTEIPEEIEFTQNDILTENAEYFYNNYLSLLDGTPTAAWNSANHSGTLADIYLLSVLEAHGHSVRVKTIPGRGLISPNTRLIDHNDRKYQIISYSHNDKTNQFSCEAVEIIEPGTIEITSNIVIEGSSSGSSTNTESTDPTTGTGKSDDRLVTMLATDGFEYWIPGRLHADYFDQDFILSYPVYIPKRLSTLKSGKVVLNKGIHDITFTTAFTEPYIFLATGSTGLAGVNIIVVDDSDLTHATIKVVVDGCTVRWEAYVISNQ
jgi:hypothetical protein